jgi:hypothetical protein
MPTQRLLVVRSLALSCAVILFAPPVVAADTVAEQLYRDGRRAAQRGDWEAACNDFRASQEREPAPGTLLNLADCEEHRGRFVDAIAHFEEAARAFPSSDDRLAYAKKRAAAAAKKVARLTLRLAPDADTATAVTVDGGAWSGASIGAATPIDPGEHVVEVRAPKRSASRVSITLASGEARELALAAGPPIATHTDATEAPPKPSDSPEAPAESPDSAPIARDAKVEPPADRGGAWRTVGYASLGLGAASLAAGITGGILTMSAKSTADAQCPKTGCNGAGLDAEQRGKTWSTVGTVGFVAGGVGIALGAAMLWLAPNHAQPSITAEPVRGGAKLEWIGRF